ncbi:hypothetical protein [Paraburkholderia sp. J63]|uniref:hypothetical protein n=1 Tax=Paraburkholderia sp. J63 TaxID=2805434 RepID=UPI002ABD86A5|nr:hypothetical protein [Paraburkholderia sp. J63]
MSRKLDTDHQVAPPSCVTWLEQRGITAGGYSDWSAEGALDLMEAKDSATGNISVSVPGLHLGDNIEAREKHAR